MPTQAQVPLHCSMVTTAITEISICFPWKIKCGLSIHNIQYSLLPPTPGSYTIYIFLLSVSEHYFHKFGFRVNIFTLNLEVSQRRHVQRLNLWRGILMKFGATHMSRISYKIPCAWLHGSLTIIFDFIHFFSTVDRMPVAQRGKFGTTKPTKQISRILQTVTCRITTFRSTTDRIYDGGPIIL